MEITSILKLAWPIVLIQIGFQIFALWDLYKRKKTRNLSPVIWILIILLGELLGPIAYFSLGQSEK